MMMVNMMGIDESALSRWIERENDSKKTEPITAYDTSKSNGSRKLPYMYHIHIYTSFFFDSYVDMKRNEDGGIIHK